MAAGGLEIQLHYDRYGLLSSAVASNDQKVAYQWDNRRHLISTQGSFDGDFRFGYDDHGRVTTAIHSRDSLLVFQNQFDPDGRLLAHTVGSKHWNFEYQRLKGGSLRSHIEDEAGNRTSFLFDSNQRLNAYGNFPLQLTVLNYNRRGRLMQIASGQLTTNPSSCIAPEIEISKIYAPL